MVLVPWVTWADSTEQHLGRGGKQCQLMGAVADSFGGRESHVLGGHVKAAWGTSAAGDRSAPPLSSAGPGSSHLDLF